MNLLDRLHWPAAALLITTVVGMLASFVAAMVLVPPAMIDKLASLPWTTILAVGVPAIVAAISAIRGAFAGPALAPRASVPPSKQAGFATIDVATVILALAFASSGLALLVSR